MDTMPKPKRAMIIEDITGAGKCSLTVALPILSVAGVECAVLPTAVLSTHPAGFTGYTYRDLTADLLPMARHWKREGLRFDALYSGFLGSVEQLEIVEHILGEHRSSETFVLIDPVMGDNGRLYSMYNERMIAGMRRLCRLATVLTPNVTEAAFLTGLPYREGPYTPAYIDELMQALGDFGAAVVLTGVYYDERRIGAVCREANAQKTQSVWSDKLPSYYHGTGDVFSAALLAGLLGDRSLAQAAQLAVDFTRESIRRTAQAGTPEREGLLFEKGLVAFGQQFVQA